MKIQFDIISENMKSEEVVDLSRQIADALFEGQKAERVDPLHGKSVKNAKGIIEIIGSLLVSLPAEAITGALGIIKAIASRPGQPQFTMKVTRNSVEVSFDPRRITPDEIATLAAKLRPEN